MGVLPALLSWNDMQIEYAALDALCLLMLLDNLIQHAAPTRYSTNAAASECSPSPSADDAPLDQQSGNLPPAVHDCDAESRVARDRATTAHDSGMSEVLMC